MSEFAILRTQVWTDPAFIELSSDARLLFLWSWTNPHAAICGLYTVSARRMREALSGDRADERIVAALLELARKPVLLFDDDAEVLWVVSRAKHSNRSAKAARVMQTEVRRCPASPLRDAFLSRYPGLAS